MPQDFNTVRRNYGHWDIYSGGKRIYRIRGGPNAYVVLPTYDEPSMKFKTVQACMSYITDQLMFELIVAEGQDFEVIEKWNV